MKIIDQKTIKWKDHVIRYVKLDDGKWYADYVDMCNILKLNPVDICTKIDKNYFIKIGENNEFIRFISESGIYQLYLYSDLIDAKNFLHWSSDIICKLRSIAGLHEYESIKLLDKDTRDKIDSLLDTIYWDEERKETMISITVQGGDVEQYPLVYWENVHGVKDDKDYEEMIKKVENGALD